jgi:hypothetical protein
MSARHTCNSCPCLISKGACLVVLAEISDQSFTQCTVWVQGMAAHLLRDASDFTNLPLQARALVIALSVHQCLEGLALGGFIATSGFTMRKCEQQGP